MYFLIVHILTVSTEITIHYLISLCKSHVAFMAQAMNGNVKLAF